MQYTLRRGPLYYRRRDRAPRWVQDRYFATPFPTEKAAWDEAELYGVDFAEIQVEPFPAGEPS